MKKLILMGLALALTLTVTPSASAYDQSYVDSILGQYAMGEIMFSELPDSLKPKALKMMPVFKNTSGSVNVRPTAQMNAYQSMRASGTSAVYRTPAVIGDNARNNSNSTMRYVRPVAGMGRVVNLRNMPKQPSMTQNTRINPSQRGVRNVAVPKMRFTFKADEQVVDYLRTRRGVNLLNPGSFQPMTRQMVPSMAMPKTPMAMAPVMMEEEMMMQEPMMMSDAEIEMMLESMLSEIVMEDVMIIDADMMMDDVMTDAEFDALFADLDLDELFEFELEVIE